MINCIDISGGPAFAKQTMASWSESLVTVVESMTAHRPKIQSRESLSTEWDEGI
jgi:hypothetical protein